MYKKYDIIYTNKHGEDELLGSEYGENPSEAVQEFWSTLGSFKMTTPSMNRDDIIGRGCGHSVRAVE